MIKDYGRAIKNIRRDLKRYILKDSIKSLIIGESGGIDSALCSVLAKKICDSINIPLIGRSYPTEHNKSNEIERARKVGENFCTEFKEIDITEDYKALIMSISKDDPNILGDGIDAKIRRGNIQARTRMIKLFDLARANRGMVLSTDNYTELLCGFWTLKGDEGNFGMIQNIWKTEEYELTDYILMNEELSKEQHEILEECRNAICTDGLGVSNSDLEQLEVKSYEEADSLLREYLDGDTSVENHPIIKRYKATEYKRNDPYNILREVILFGE